MLKCLQEPHHGHIITVPSCLIFCLNINRWVNISNFLRPSSCREFICTREGFRIRASHWGCFQAICSGRLMSCSKITPCSYLVWSAMLQRASHVKPQHWFKETTAQLFCALLLLVQNGNFPRRLNWLKGPLFFHLAAWANLPFLSFPADLGPAGEQKSPFLRCPDWPKKTGSCGWLSSGQISGNFMPVYRSFCSYWPWSLLLSFPKTAINVFSFHQKCLLFIPLDL